MVNLVKKTLQNLFERRMNVLPSKSPIGDGPSVHTSTWGSEPPSGLREVSCFWEEKDAHAADSY